MEKKCSFCGTSEESYMIYQKGLYICEKCVQTCMELIEKNKLSKEKEEVNKKILSPSMIKKQLDRRVVGQEYAKKTLSVAVYNHMKRISQKSQIPLEKSNILIYGPTGSGKTLLAKSLAEIVGVPFAIADATSLTETGYVGDDAVSILTRLLQNAGNDLSAAQRGIIYIDEIDKLANPGGEKPVTRDVTGGGVQQALLKIMEGTKVSVPVSGGRKYPGIKEIMMDTTDILFICGGAFPGLEKDRRIKRTLGFQVTEEKEESAYSPVDSLKKYGMLPELLGRLPVMVELEELNENALVQILTEPDNAIVKQYVELMRMDGVELNFEKEALFAMAKKAITNKTGARGLRSIMESTMNDLMFTLPDEKNIKTCTITEGSVLHKEYPKIQRKEAPIE